MIKYLVMMPNSWGVGDSVAEADKKAREHGRHGRKKVKRLCWKYNSSKTPEVYINDWGNLCWKGDRPERIELDAKEIAK